MPESPLKGPVPEDVLAVAGHCCSVRLTRLPELEDGIDFTPAAAAKADFDRLRRGDPAAVAASDAAVPPAQPGDTP